MPQSRHGRAALTMRPVLLVLAAVLATDTGAARADDSIACTSAIATVEHKVAMPPRVLGAIALVESGRAVGRRVVPWPWSINVGGVGRYFASKAEAIEAVRTLHAAGQRSIDVGCMQINLAAHPQAFASLDAAFDPPSNTDYAARFLQALYRQSGRLAWAMTAYHSQTPEFANDYARRLLAVWPGGAQLGLSGGPAPEMAKPPRVVSRILLDTAETGTEATPSALRVISRHGSAWPR